MSFAWHEIHDQLKRSSSTYRFQCSFEAMRQDREPLARFPDPAAVLDTLHRDTGDADGKNRILAALAEAGQGDSSATAGAVTLLLLALWPGLDAIRRRALWRRVGSADEITSEILARTTEALCSLDLNRVHWIAATVLRNVERDLTRARRRELAVARFISSKDLDDIADANGPQGAGLSDGLLRRDLYRVLGRDAPLMIRVAIEGYEQSEAASTFGLSAAAAFKRVQRAKHRLRQAPQDFL